nr:hypothetical protein [uncultured Allisonella sp.]
MNAEAPNNPDDVLVYLVPDAVAEIMGRIQMGQPMTAELPGV